MPELRYGADYSSIHRLSDGTEVRLRPIRPEDREELQAGFERLSPESRYHRFLAATPKLTEKTLRYLTETDGWNHFAIGAETVTEASLGARGLGVARFMRLKDDSDAAEAAVAVIDEMHGRGLGRLLLLTLVEAAAERGVRTFVAHLLPDNEPAKELFRTIDASARVRFEDDLLTYEIALPGPAPEEVRATPLYDLFRRAGAGLEVLFSRLNVGPRR